MHACVLIYVRMNYVTVYIIYVYCVNFNCIISNLYMFMQVCIYVYVYIHVCNVCMHVHELYLINNY